MQIKCPNCASALVFDAIKDKMRCHYCDSIFLMSDIEEQIKVGEQKQIKYDSNKVGSDTMQCDIYACTSCGAELAVNCVEASTFCAYCGQPTIVFSRVSQELKPEVIIPFKIQKQQAIDIIRNRFNKGKFIPKEIKNFELDRICGIYIPYWLVDAYYHDRQLIRGFLGEKKDSLSQLYLREADCQFCNVPLDASLNLNDDSSQRLEPYYLKELQPFQVGYLSGFYADRFDVDDEKLCDSAMQRCKELFDEQMLDSCRVGDKMIVCSKPRMDVLKKTYAMLPAWFMTFRYKDEPYTMLVNGQTGKVIGAIPGDNAEVKNMIAPTFFKALVPNVLISVGSYLASVYLYDELWVVNLLMIFFIIGMSYEGFTNLKKLRKSKKLTASKTINMYANNRQK